MEGLEKDETPTVSGASIPAESPEGVAVLAAGGGVASLAGSVGDSAGMTGSSSVIPLMAAGGIVLLVIAFSLTMVRFEKAFAGQR